MRRIHELISIVFILVLYNETQEKTLVLMFAFNQFLILVTKVHGCCLTPSCSAPGGGRGGGDDGGDGDSAGDFFLLH